MWALGVAIGVSTGRADEIEVQAAVVNLIDEVRVPAREAGAITRIEAREGTRVKAGELLVQFDDADAALEVSRAQIALDNAVEAAANDVEVRKAQQRLKVTELDLKNAEDANNELAKVVSDSQMQKLRIEVESARLGIEKATRDLAAAQRAVIAARNDLQIARRAVERRRILAPSDGIVVEIRRRAGEWVQLGESVIRVVKDDRLRVEGFVHVNDLRGVRAGLDADLETSLPGARPARFPGKVTFVSPEANPINGQVRVWAEFENKEARLRAGVAARLVIKRP